MGLHLLRWDQDERLTLTDYRQELTEALAQEAGASGPLIHVQELPASAIGQLTLASALPLVIVTEGCSPEVEAAALAAGVRELIDLQRGTSVAVRRLLGQLALARCERLSEARDGSFELQFDADGNSSSPLPNALAVGDGPVTLAVVEGLLTPASRAEWQNQWLRARDHGESSAELILDGQPPRWFEHRIQRCEEGGWRCLWRDISNAKGQQQRWSQLADFDPLTGLPNRRLLNRVLESRIEEALAANESFALLFVDLHRFKDINDTLGHSFGDQLLMQITTLMKEKVSSDHVLCRFGGDEFVIITPPLAEPELAARQLAIRVVSELDQPFELQGKTLYVGASVGIALCPAHGSTVDELVKHADIAMFQAKSRGTGDVMIFSASMAASRRYRVELEGRFRAALLARQFVLHFQPIVELASGRVRGAEALLRWEEPELGMIPPADFIPLAEANGLIRDLGKQVIELAFSQARSWLAAGIELPISVNLSVLQLSDPDFLRHILACAERYRLGLNRIHFEITESMLFDHTDEKLALLRELQKRGAQIALDDFGTGFSSLSNLARLPVNVMKIDRSFITAMLESDNDRQVVNSVVQLARTLGKVVVAEGIETEEHRALLMMLGCELGQGFLFAHPMPGELLAEWLQQLDGDGVFAWTEAGLANGTA